MTLDMKKYFVFSFKENKKGDILMAISGSGNSPNVINAVEYGKNKVAKLLV